MLQPLDANAAKYSELSNAYNRITHTVQHGCFVIACNFIAKKTICIWFSSVQPKQLTRQLQMLPPAEMLSPRCGLAAKNVASALCQLASASLMSWPRPTTLYSLALSCQLYTISFHYFCCTRYWILEHNHRYFSGFIMQSNSLPGWVTIYFNNSGVKIRWENGQHPGAPEFQVKKNYLPLPCLILNKTGQFWTIYLASDQTKECFIISMSV